MQGWSDFAVLVPKILFLPMQGWSDFAVLVAPKRQNVITRASGEKGFLFRSCLKDYSSGLFILATK